MSIHNTNLANKEGIVGSLGNFALYLCSVSIGGYLFDESKELFARPSTSFGWNKVHVCSDEGVKLFRAYRRKLSVLFGLTCFLFALHYSLVNGK